jgi:hypothetical protein
MNGACTICRDIPQHSREFWKGGDLQGNNMPAATAKLEIIGWPYYNDDTSSSNQCFKQCPECGTVYQWDMEYEYIVNGSEDDITLTRLNEADGKAAINRILAAVDASKQRFLDEGAAFVQVLDQSTDDVKLYEAAHFFEYHQLVLHEDISFAVPALVAALLAHIHKKENCTVGDFLSMALRGYMERSVNNEVRVKSLLAARSDAKIPPEAANLIQCTPSEKTRNYWEGLLRSRGTHG